MNLRQHEISLWLQDITDEQKTPEEIFTEKELQRYQQIASNGKRREFFSSRLLLKKILTHYLPEQARDIYTETDKWGRPFWHFQQKRIPLYFSLSHTKGIIACIVARNPEIGCDIEQIRPRRYEKELATKIFAEKEMAQYQQQENTAACRSFFYRCWTLKEAYLKAKGIGIRESLSQLDFSGSINHSHFFHLSPEEQEQAYWQFHQQFLTEGYSLALAVKGKKKIVLHKEMNLSFI